MAEKTKSVEEVKAAISDHFIEVNNAMSNQAKQIGTITKNIQQVQEDQVNAVKKAPARNVKDIQRDYAVKGSEMLDYFAGTPSNRGSLEEEDYDEILDENLQHLKDIVREDLVNSKVENEKLVDETKAKLHDTVINLFNNRQANKNFSTTAASLFENFNKKLKDDWIMKNLNAQKTRSSLSPDLARMFGDPRKKPQEEIEAEKLLQEYFEEEILAFSEQSKNNFQKKNETIQTEISETMAKIKQTLLNLQAAGAKDTQAKSVDALDSKSIPNVPTKRDMERNVNKFLERAENDFKKVGETMKNDVENKKRKINENAKYYAEKFLGKKFGSSDDEED